MSQQYASQQAPEFRNHLENVAMVGVGGTVGKYIAEAILKSGKHKLTAITRPDSTAKLPSGITVKKVDYSTDDISQLVDALRGQDILIITMGVAAQGDPQKKLIDAAAQAGIHWIMPNEWGLDGNNVELGEGTTLGPRMKVYRDQIEQLGMSWLGFACSFWYEYSLAGGADRYGFDFEKKEVLFYDDGQTKINTSSWPQVGRGVAALLSFKVLPQDEHDDVKRTLSYYRNKYLYITSFKVSQQDMLDSILRVTNAKPDDWEITKRPAEDCYEESKKELMSGNYAAFARMLYSRGFFNDGGLDFESRYGLSHKVLGLQHENLDDYTKAALEMDTTPWASNHYGKK